MNTLMEDTGGETFAEITTDGSTFKPFINTLRTVAAEGRIQVGVSGLRSVLIDSGNVQAIDLSLNESAFEDYNGSSGIVGANLKTLRSLTRRARVNTEDALELSVSERQIGAKVSRGYDDFDIVTNDTMDTLDPDSIRKAEYPERDGLDQEYVTVELSRSALQDAFGHVIGEHDHAKISSNDGDFTVRGMDSGPSSNLSEGSLVVVEGMGVEEDYESIFASHYLNDMMDAIRSAKADSATIHYSDEYPIYVDFERTVDGNTVMEGTIMQAPRIRA